MFHSGQYPSASAKVVRAGVVLWLMDTADPGCLGRFHELGAHMIPTASTGIEVAQDDHLKKSEEAI